MRTGVVVKRIVKTFLAPSWICRMSSQRTVRGPGLLSTVRPVNSFGVAGDMVCMNLELRLVEKMFENLEEDQKPDIVHARNSINVRRATLLWW